MGTSFCGFTVAALLCVVLGFSAGTERNKDGLQLTVDIEARAADGKTQSEDVRALPDGHVQIEYVTNGRLVRRTLHGRMLDHPDGTVTLTREQDSKLIVLDPEAKTYYLRDASSGEPEAGTYNVDITWTPVFRLMLGHRARKVTIDYREGQVGARANKTPGRVPEAFRAQLEIWCTTDMPLPPHFSRMMNDALTYVGGARGEDFVKRCPLPMQSTVRISTLPSVQIWSTVTSIRRIPTPPALFTLPAGYRERQ